MRPLKCGTTEFWELGIGRKFAKNTEPGSQDRRVSVLGRRLHCGFWRKLDWDGKRTSQHGVGVAGGVQLLQSVVLPLIAKFADVIHDADEAVVFPGLLQDLRECHRSTATVGFGDAEVLHAVLKRLAQRRGLVRQLPVHANDVRLGRAEANRVVNCNTDSLGTPRLFENFKQRPRAPVGRPIRR